MAGDYKELFKYNNRLWLSECPVILENAGLFISNNTNKVIALCKFRNITLEKIKAVYLVVTCYGIDGAILNTGIDFVYLDMSVSANGLFGDKTPITIPDHTTRRIDITVKKVIFENDTFWENPNHIKFQSIMSANPTSCLGEFEEAYKWKTGFSVLPLENSEYWVCGCNNLNLLINPYCLNCKAEKKTVFLQAEQQYLESTLQEYKQHLEQERIKEDEEAEAKITAVKKKQYIKTLALVAVLVLIVCIVVVNQDSANLKSAKSNATTMLLYESMASSTYDLAQTYRRYDGVNSKDYKSEMEYYNDYKKQSEESKAKYLSDMKKLNEKEIKELNDFIANKKAELAKH
jgi:hypothetical protein